MSTGLTSWRISRALRILPSLLAPVATAVAQHFMWPMIRPFAWFLFYPSVLLSSWIGGVTGGILATLLSVSLAWWGFVPPEHTFSKDDPRYLMPALVFLTVGIVISFIQGRLKRTTGRMVKALSDAQMAGDRLQGAHDDIARLIDQASDGIFIAKNSGHLLHVNEAACSMRG